MFFRLHCTQVFSRLTVRVSTKYCQMSFDLLASSLHFPVHTPPTRLQVSSRKEFDVNCEDSWSFNDTRWGKLDTLSYDYSRSITTRDWSFNSSHKTVLRNSPKQNLPIRVSHDLNFMFIVYGFDLIVKVWVVFIVLDLEVPGRFCDFTRKTYVKSSLAASVRVNVCHSMTTGCPTQVHQDLLKCRGDSWYTEEYLGQGYSGYSGGFG